MPDWFRDARGIAWVGIRAPVGDTMSNPAPEAEAVPADAVTEAYVEAEQDDEASQ